MGTKKTQKQTSQQTTTAAPPTWTLPGLQTAGAAVTNAMQQAQSTPIYNGPFVAQPNMDLVNAAKAGYKGAAAAVPGAVQAIQGGIDSLGALPSVTTGSYNAGAAYDIAPAIQAATAPILRQLTEQTLPGLRSSAIESGAYSGDRAMSVVPEAVIGQAMRDAQDTAATIGLQDYSQREARRLAGYQTDQANSLEAQQFNNTMRQQIVSMLPDLINNQMLLRSSVGDLNSAALGLDTQAQQAQIDNALAANDNAIKAPFRGLDIASALLAQLSGNYGTTSSNGTQTSVQSSSGLGNVVQGLAGLAGMVGAFPVAGGGTVGGNFLGSLFKPAAKAA